MKMTRCVVIPSAALAMTLANATPQIGRCIAPPLVELRSWGRPTGRRSSRHSCDTEVARARVGEPLGEGRRDLILGRDNRRNVRPPNLEGGVAPAYAALAPDAVRRGAFVQHDRVVGEREGAVREAR